MLVTPAALPQPGAVGEEQAVWKAMADAIVRDNAKRPYKQLYFKRISAPHR